MSDQNQTTLETEPQDVNNDPFAAVLAKAGNIAPTGANIDIDSPLTWTLCAGADRLDKGVVRAANGSPVFADDDGASWAVDDDGCWRAVCASFGIKWEWLEPETDEPQIEPPAAVTNNNISEQWQQRLTAALQDEQATGAKVWASRREKQARGLFVDDDALADDLLICMVATAARNLNELLALARDERGEGAAVGMRVALRQYAAAPEAEPPAAV